MIIKINSIILNLADNSPLVIGQQTFSNEIIFDQDISCAILGKIHFLNCEVEEVNFTGSSFGTCIFENCTFQEVNFIASDLQYCEFTEPKFKNIDLDVGYMRVTDLKVWKLNEIKDFYSFEEFFRDME
jgi:uncharacterized protein YjbI with pentapeptide repeats